MKIMWIFLLPIIALGQHSYLVSIELDSHRLTPLYDGGLTVIGQFNNYAFSVVGESELQKLESFRHQVLDNDPVAGPYYFVKVLRDGIDLTKYGTVLVRDNDDVLIKLFAASPEALMKEKVMLKFLTLKPIVHKPAPHLNMFRADPTIAEIVSLVDADSILATVQRLQDFVTRYSTHDSCDAAANYIASRLAQYGCDSIIMQNHTSGHAPNVIGIKTGQVYPENIYTLICGHFDSYSYEGQNVAPGADDNASGVASVIEACRVMQNYDFEYSVRYIAFSGEEFGLYGSAYYAYYARYANDSILGAFNADMIAYVDAAPETLEVMGQIDTPPCEPLIDFFITCADTYTTLLTYKRLTYDWIASDNQSFNDQGYLALLDIEDYYPSNPYFHHAADTIGAGFNDLSFCNEVTRAQVAALATMAVPYETGVVEFFPDKGSMQAKLVIKPTVGNKKFDFQVEGENGTTGAFEVYNSVGRQVNRFGNVRALHWDGTDSNGQELPAGVYFIRSSIDGEPYSGKLIITR